MSMDRRGFFGWLAGAAAAVGLGKSKAETNPYAHLGIDIDEVLKGEAEIARGEWDYLEDIDWGLEDIIGCRGGQHFWSHPNPPDGSHCECGARVRTTMWWHDKEI